MIPPSLLFHGWEDFGIAWRSQQLGCGAYFCGEPCISPLLPKSKSSKKRNEWQRNPPGFMETTLYYMSFLPCKPATSSFRRHIVAEIHPPVGAWRTLGQLFSIKRKQQKDDPKEKWIFVQKWWEKKTFGTFLKLKTFHLDLTPHQDASGSNKGLARDSRASKNVMSSW